MQVKWTLPTSRTLGNLKGLLVPWLPPQAVCQCNSCIQERTATIRALCLPHQEPLGKPSIQAVVLSLGVLASNSVDSTTAPLTDYRTNEPKQGSRPVLPVKQSR
jgi:hypothetical protein